ncbi:hypothetical protein X975_24900, partial [Stegodyphus mimosarum]
HCLDSSHEFSTLDMSTDVSSGSEFSSHRRFFFSG